MSTLYLECASGISGDMTVAALLDLGADPELLRRGLDSLGVGGYHLHLGRATKAGIDACDFDVHLENGAAHHHHQDDQPDRHHDHTHEHSHEHPHDHDHAHQHTHSANERSHEHRGLTEITSIIHNSSVSSRAKDLALRVFTVVAEAEARVHGLPVDQVHFHEVGAIDSIVDIVGAAICLDSLQVDRVICSPLREGTGTVRCQHGVIPIPAPATLEIVRAHDIPMVITDLPGELVTPTGAAIVAAIADSFVRPPAMRVLKTGYGAGKRDYPHTANLLRASLVELLEETDGDQVLKLECNLDDMTGEELAFACERLLEAGALDVWCTPILMKKGRPGQLLSVLLAPALEEALTDLVFRHTSTIGVRVSAHRRHILQRRCISMETPHGELPAKESTWRNIRKIKTEYDEARRLALAEDVPLQQVLCRVHRKED